LTACYIMAGSGGTATGAWAGWEKRVARVAFLFAWCRFRRRLARLVHRRSRALFLQRHQLGRRRSSAWSIYRPCGDLSAVEPRGRRGPTLRQGRGGRHQARLQGPCRDGDRARLRKRAAQAQGTASSIIPTSVSRRAARHSPAQAIFRTMTEPICSTAPCCSQTATTSPMSIKSSPPFLSAPTQRPRSRWRPRTRNSASCFPSKRETPDRLSAAQPRCRSRHASAAATRRSARSRSDHILVGDRGCNYPGCGERHELGRGWHKSDPRSELDLREHSIESRAHHPLSGVQDRERGHRHGERQECRRVHLDR
jgi:hypothetical protein